MKMDKLNSVKIIDKLANACDSVYFDETFRKDADNLLSKLRNDALLDEIKRVVGLENSFAERVKKAKRNPHYFWMCQMAQKYKDKPNYKIVVHYFDDVKVKTEILLNTTSKSKPHEIILNCKFAGINNRYNILFNNYCPQIQRDENSKKMKEYRNELAKVLHI